MKRLSVLIALLLALLAVLGLTVYNHKTKQDENIDIIYADRASSINKVCELNGTYYYTGDKGIYSDGKCVVNTDVKPMICTNNDTLYVCEGKTITGYDSSLSQLCKYELSTEVAKFAVSDNEIFYIDTDGNFHVLDIAASTENKEVETETVNDNIIIHHYSDFLVCEDKNNSSIAAFWGDNIVSSVKEYSKRFVYLSDNCLIHTSTTNTSTIICIKPISATRQMTALLVCRPDMALYLFFL